MSTITFTKRFESRELRDNNDKMAGSIHKQFVIIAPFTTSNSGSTLKNNNATPIVCRDSAMNTCKKNENETVRVSLESLLLVGDLEKCLWEAKS